MPLDFPTRVPARLLTRLARANALNDPAACDNWLRDRFDDEKRIPIMRELFPSALVEGCA
ncbi:hypothetical protein BD830_105235 [Maritimibacter alkaliphilus HTCC2654]|uniref:hypothetical protein n=1 Tax=Maritimibacter alkaliphilus TaxID=404236 RepID=UPI00030EC5E6|nr:hypothetical protein [Maritimibacter alkaliphilus]TYP81568.1 hypothetical protein BD830_105235 [Maritimibacter alkaliphilus HTCC2654]